MKEVTVRQDHTMIDCNKWEDICMSVIPESGAFLCSQYTVLTQVTI